MTTTSKTNFKLLAVKLGDALKYHSTYKEIDRLASAIFPFACTEFEKHSSITSIRAQLIYDWVLTLDAQQLDDDEKVSLLQQFIESLTPGDHPARSIVGLQTSTKAMVVPEGWNLIHPSIQKIAAPRFSSSTFADAVEAALKHVNSRVKTYVKDKVGEELDGAPLMNRAFSPKNPVIVLDDLATETGRNIQLGYMQIFAGAMIGIRNPKAHANIEITKERAMHFLMLASLLMAKLDDAECP